MAGGCGTGTADTQAHQRLERATPGRRGLGRPGQHAARHFRREHGGALEVEPAEAAALLTDIAAVSDSPLSVMLEEMAGGTIQYSPTLRKELEDAPWGEALPNGLRVACLLEPRAAEHRLGTPLKMRSLGLAGGSIGIACV